MENKFIPYGRHVVAEEDVAAVMEVLRGDWLTTGPAVQRFEDAFAAYVAARHAVAVSSGTAALHLCVLAVDIRAGDEVVVPALTFAASANCARYAGADVRFADVRDDTLTIDVAHASTLITRKTRAIVAVDYGGLPCDLHELTTLAASHGLPLIEDACHAPGAEYRGNKVGGLATLSTFSFHPVKHLTTAEGGMVTTQDAALAERLRCLRNHGITTDHRQREQRGTWLYDMVQLGYNYRLNDIQCALGLSQLRRMPQTLARRRQLAAQYNEALSSVAALQLPREPNDRRHAWHLYPVRLLGSNAAAAREKVFAALRAAQIGVNVHYLPVYLHPYYRSLGYRPGLCPVAEKVYEGLLSLPMWHGLTDLEQERVVVELKRAIERYA